MRDLQNSDILKHLDWTKRNLEKAISTGNINKKFCYEG